MKSIYFDLETLVGLHSGLVVSTVATELKSPGFDFRGFLCGACSYRVCMDFLWSGMLKLSCVFVGICTMQYTSDLFRSLLYSPSVSHCDFKEDEKTKKWTVNKFDLFLSYIYDTDR